MIREEIEKERQYQLTDAAIDYYRKEYPHYDEEMLGEIVDAFEEGAKWADEHPKEGMVSLDKVCKWLQTNTHFFVSDITGDINENRLIQEFKKAMEE